MYKDFFKLGKIFNDIGEALYVADLVKNNKKDKLIKHYTKKAINKTAYNVTKKIVK